MTVAYRDTVVGGWGKGTALSLKLAPLTVVPDSTGFMHMDGSHG